MNEQPSFYAIIPANVRYAEISSSAKLFYGEISALTKKEGYCWASNRYFSELYHTSEKTITRWLKELEVIGVVAVDVTKTPEGTNRSIKLSHPSDKNVPPPSDKNVQTPQDKNVPQINILPFNNTKTDKRKIAEAIYKFYPSKDVNNRNRSTSKTLKLIDKIERILNDGKYPLGDAVKAYVRHAAMTKSFLKNLAVFLNNLPDKEEIEDWQKQIDKYLSERDDDDTLSVKFS